LQRHQPATVGDVEGHQTDPLHAHHAVVPHRCGKRKRCRTTQWRRATPSRQTPQSPAFE
jgi:hypothetical protein